MYICPECGEKLDKNATICPCCGRGNRDNHNNKYDFILIVFGLIILSIGIITTVSFAYSGKETKYDGVNYSFIYKNNYWLSSKEVKSLDDSKDILVFNDDSNIYIQFDKEMIDIGYDVDIDSSRDDLYNFLYKGLINYSSKEYSGVSPKFNRIEDKYYITSNYYKNNISAKMYIVCYHTKMMSFYIVHNGKNYQQVEEKILDIIKTIEIK